MWWRLSPYVVEGCCYVTEAVTLSNRMHVEVLLRRRAADIDARAAAAAESLHSRHIPVTVKTNYTAAAAASARARARAQRPCLLERELAATVRRALPLET